MPQTYRLTLASTLDVAAAQPLATEVLGARGRPLTVDASRVERLGAQCAQVLLAAQGTWNSDDVQLALVEPSPAFVEALKILGLSESFDLSN
jgi:chemotaxis protein CheX